MFTEEEMLLGYKWVDTAPEWVDSDGNEYLWPNIYSDSKRFEQHHYPLYAAIEDEV